MVLHSASSMGWHARRARSRQQRFSPRWKCCRRVAAVEPGTGLPEPAEEPADIVNGLVHEACPDTVLAEFDWIDRPPVEKAFVALLYGAADALGEAPLD